MAKSKKTQAQRQEAKQGQCKAAPSAASFKTTLEALQAKSASVTYVTKSYFTNVVYRKSQAKAAGSNDKSAEKYYCVFDNNREIGEDSENAENDNTENTNPENPTDNNNPAPSTDTELAMQLELEDLLPSENSNLWFVFRENKSGNWQLHADCGLMDYKERFTQVRTSADLKFDAQASFDKIQHAMEYLKNHLNSSNSCLNTCKRNTGFNSSISNTDAGLRTWSNIKGKVDLSDPILRPMAPGEDLIVSGGRILCVVWSKQRPTYYDLSIAGKNDDLLNLTYSRTGASSSIALGSGDQLGNYDGAPRLVHDFEFIPERLAAGHDGIGGIMFSGYQSTRLKAWSEDRPIVMIVHVNEEEVEGEASGSSNDNAGGQASSSSSSSSSANITSNTPQTRVTTTVHYCPAPMNERIGDSITYGAISFQMLTSMNEGNMRAAWREVGVKKDKKDTNEKNEKDASKDSGDGGWKSPKMSQTAPTGYLPKVGQIAKDFRMRFYLHTAQEGFCPGNLDRSAPVSGGCYKHYYDDAVLKMQRTPILQEEEEVSSDEEKDGVEKSGQDAEKAKDVGREADKVDEEEKSKSQKVEAWLPSAIVLSNSRTLTETKTVLGAMGMLSDDGVSSNSGGNAGNSISTSFDSLNHIVFSNGFSRVLPSKLSNVLQTEANEQPSKALSPAWDPLFLGQFSSSIESIHPSLLLLGKIDEGLNWSVDRPCVMVVGDAKRIPYEALTFKVSGEGKEADGKQGSIKEPNVKGNFNVGSTVNVNDFVGDASFSKSWKHRACVDNCLLIIHTEVDPSAAAADASGSTAPPTIGNLIGPVDLNPLQLLGQKSAVIAVVFEKTQNTGTAQNTSAPKKLLGIRVLRVGPKEGCGLTRNVFAGGEITSGMTAGLDKNDGRGENTLFDDGEKGSSSSSSAKGAKGTKSSGGPPPTVYKVGDEITKPAEIKKFWTRVNAWMAAGARSSANSSATNMGKTDQRAPDQEVVVHPVDTHAVAPRQQMLLLEDFGADAGDALRKALQEPDTSNTASVQDIELIFKDLMPDITSAATPRGHLHDSCNSQFPRSLSSYNYLHLNDAISSLQNAFSVQLEVVFGEYMKREITKMFDKAKADQKINDAAAGITDDTKIPEEERKKRIFDLRIKKHGMFDLALTKFLEKGDHVLSKSSGILENLEWFLAEKALAELRKQLVETWNQVWNPAIMKMHQDCLAVGDDGSGADSTTDNTAKAPAAVGDKEFLTLYNSGELDLHALRQQLKLKRLAPQIEKKLQHFARVFDLSSKLKPNATYSMVVQLAAAAHKRGARAQAKMDKLHENLSKLKTMDRDAFLDFFSQEDVCENVVHACIEPTQTPDRLLAELEWLCGPERSFFRGAYGPAAGLSSNHYDFGEADRRRNTSMQAQIQNHDDESDSEDDYYDQGNHYSNQATGGNYANSAATARDDTTGQPTGVTGTSSSHSQALSQQLSRTDATSARCVALSNRILTLETDILASIASHDVALANVAVNRHVVENSQKQSQLPLAYMPTATSSPCIPIPIFTRYASRDAGCEENFMTAGTYIAWDEESAQEDVQLWRIAVTNVIKNSAVLARAVGDSFGAVTDPKTGSGVSSKLNSFELDLPNSQWLLIKVLIDVGLTLAGRINTKKTSAAVSGLEDSPARQQQQLLSLITEHTSTDLSEIADDQKFDTLPSMLRSIVLTIAGILQSGDKPLGTGWSLCKNTAARPALPEEKRDWHTCLALAKLYPKTGLPSAVFKSNLRSMLVRFFNKIVEPYVQQLHHDYKKRKTTYDDLVAGNYVYHTVEDYMKAQGIKSKNDIAHWKHKPSRFCAACWKLKEPWFFGRPNSGGRTWYKALDALGIDRPTVYQGTFPAKYKEMTGVDLKDLFESTESRVSETASKRTNNAKRSVIMVRPYPQCHEISKGILTKEQEEGITFDVFKQRVQQVCCSARGNVCCQCLLEAGKISKNDLKAAGGMVKSLKDAADLPDKCADIDPIPSATSAIQNQVNDRLKKLAIKLGVSSKAIADGAGKGGNDSAEKAISDSAVSAASSTNKYPELQQSAFEDLVKNSFKDRVDKEKYQLLEWQREANQVHEYRKSSAAQSKAGTGFRREALTGTNTEAGAPAFNDSAALGIYSLAQSDTTSGSSGASSSSLAVTTPDGNATAVAGRVHAVAVPGMYSSLERLYCGDVVDRLGDFSPRQAMVGSEIMQRLTFDFCMAIQEFDSASSTSNTALTELQLAEQTRAVASLISLYRGPDADVMAELLRVSGLCGNLHEAGSRIMRQLIETGFKEKETMDRERGYLMGLEDEEEEE